MRDTPLNHIEQHWKTLTISANKAFNKSNFDEALSGYQRALNRAEELNNNADDCLKLRIPFVQVYIISCNNISSTYSALQQPDEAKKMLKRVVYYLQHLTKQSKVDREEIQNELKRATVALLSLVDNNRKN